MSTTITHIAGPCLFFDQHQRQRCSWCGYLLIDQDLTRVGIPVGQDPKPTEWPFEAMVEVVEEDGFTATRTLDEDEILWHDDGSIKVPDNFCRS
jgi:hypothetical protein